MKEQKVQDGGVGGRTVVLLVFRYVNADFLTRPCCEHIVLSRLKSSLTNQKLSGATQEAATLMISMLELFTEGFEFVFQFGPISLYDFVNERSQTQWHKFFHFSAVFQT